MENIKEIISSGAIELIGVIIATFFAWLGLRIKTIASNYFDTNTKQIVATSVVRGVEQMYKDLNGEQKLEIAIERILEILDDKGIIISDAEIRMFIESAVKGINEGWQSLTSTLVDLDEPDTLSDFDMFDPDESFDEEYAEAVVETFVEDNDVAFIDEDDDVETVVEVAVDAETTDKPENK